MTIRWNHACRAAIAGLLLLGVWQTHAQPEPPHPILTISGSGSGASGILSSWTEAQYTNNFTPRLGPRNDSYGFVPAVVSGDTGWSWSTSNPNQITSTPSGTVFPNGTYTVLTQAVTVMNGNVANAPYYLRAGSATAKSLPLNLIAYRQRAKLRSDFNALAPAYMNSGATHATRNQAYARRIAVALLDWARYFPDYTVTGKNNATFINTGPSYILSSDLQRASDHNGLAHEWADDELLAFDAIYDSPALADLSTELGFDVRGYITTNLFCNEGDFIVYHVPPDVATDSNLSGPYTILALVARVLNRPDYIGWMDEYLGITVREKIHRDGTLSEGMGYSIGYINENENAATYTRDYFNVRPANTPELVAISNRASSAVSILKYGQQQWSKMSLPNGQLPSFGDTGFNTITSARNTGISALLPSYGALALGVGSGSQSVQLHQIYAGNNNHMRSDTTAFALWAFGNEMLGNVRYHNGTPGRQFTEQILAYNAVTIDRSDMSSPSANTHGNCDLTLYEPGTNGIAVTEIDGQRAYANKASRYQRIMMLNTFDIARPYVVDVFRVTGGKTHDYVLHGSIRYDQNWECSFPLVTNASPYPMLEGSETWSEPTSSGSSFPYYGFWRNVSSNTASGDFQITYRDTLSSNRDLRLWMTGGAGLDVNIGHTPVPSRSNGEPDDWWVNGLWRPSSIIRKRITSGTLQDLFVSVIEPMNNGVSVIQNVERLPMNGSSLESCALKIAFTDGRVDTVLVNLRNPQVAGANTGSATVSTTNGQFLLTGRIGVHTTGSAGSRVWAVNASQFNYPGGTYAPSNLYYSGSIIGETRKATGGANDAFITTTPLPTGTALRGKQMSLTFGALSGSGTTGISEMFEIDQVLQTNGQYHICFARDHQLEMTDVLTISASGSDIWNTADQFRYAYQSVSGNTSVVARVVSQTGTHAFAKAGVMIRESTAANAVHAAVLLTPNNGVAMEVRPTTGASTLNITGWIAGQTPPTWVRLDRSGSTFTGYYSQDGVVWTQMAATNVTMNSSATMGLAVTSHDNAQLNTAGFDNISLPGPLTHLDIGAVSLAGSSSSSSISLEQMGPLRTFTGVNQFEIALSASQPASAPVAPVGLAASAGNGQVALSWNALLDATRYNVKRSTVNGGPYTVIASPTSNSFIDAGVTNGMTHYYVVSAVNEAGEGPDSVQASATPNDLALPGLVARLTFDDDTANDSSGNTNHGTLVNGAAIVTDAQRGKVLSLDGSNDYVDLGNGASLNLSDNNQATITAWVKMAVSKSHNSIVTKGEWKDCYSLLLNGDAANKDKLWTGNDTGVFSGGAVPLNTWTHVAVVISNDLTSFYLNGELSGTANQDRGNAIDNTGTGVSIGREQYSGSLPAGRWFFNGQMDDVRIYEVALNQSGIQGAMSNIVNNAPTFVTEPLSKPAVAAGENYAASLAGDATDPDVGDALIYSKLGGPAWLTVAGNGGLSGMPASADVGTNSFTVRVTDPIGFFDQTVLSIPVVAAAPIISSMSWQGGNLQLNWTGGVPPYQVRMKTNLQDSVWQNYGGPVESNSLLIVRSNAASFYRIEGQ